MPTLNIIADFVAILVDQLCVTTMMLRHFSLWSKEEESDAIILLAQIAESKH